MKTQRAMLVPHIFAQLCATTRHMASCGTKLCTMVWHQHFSNTNSKNYFFFSIFFLGLVKWKFSLGQKKGGARGKVRQNYNQRRCGKLGTTLN